MLHYATLYGVSYKGSPTLEDRNKQFKPIHKETPRKAILVMVIWLGIYSECSITSATKSLPSVAGLACRPAPVAGVTCAPDLHQALDNGINNDTIHQWLP